MVLPDYAGGSIVNLMASIEAACGGNPRYAPLRELAQDELATAGDLVLLVIDGLGYQHLHRVDGHLRQHLRAGITSVFPTTTATAVTTFLTGLAPAQHGLTGWHMYFREIGAVAAVLPLRPRTGTGSLREAGVEPAALLTCGSFFDRLATPAHVVSPERIIHSDFNVFHAGHAVRHGFDSLDQLFEQVAAIVHERRGRRLIYAYYPGLDSLAHQYGIASPQAAAELARLDQGFGRLLDDLRGRGSTVIATADHGFVDVASAACLDLADHPALAETLVLPLCGESRVAYCYVHPDKRGQFEAYARNELADFALMFDSRHLLEQGWFGPGQPHPRLAERIGHYALVMRENYALKEWLLGEKRYRHVGMHGGVSEAEMVVPLIVARP